MDGPCDLKEIRLVRGWPAKRKTGGGRASGIARGGGPDCPLLPLAIGPVERPKDRLQWLNKPPTLNELEALRRSMRKGVPCEEVDCQRTAIREHGLESSIRRPVRPKKEPQ